MNGPVIGDDLEYSALARNLGDCQPETRDTNTSEPQESGLDQLDLVALGALVVDVICFNLGGDLTWN